MAKNKSKVSEKRMEKISAEPTIYTFNFKDVPMERYAETIKLLFHGPNFVDAVEKRNALVKCAGRMKQNSQEILSLIKQIQQRDHKLADVLFATLVQTNRRSDVTYDFLSFTTLLKYYVDYSKTDIMQKVDELTTHLDKITFLSEFLESELVEVAQGMRLVFGDTIEFQQFDGVQQSLKQLKGFFRTIRSNNDNTPEADLYWQYSDSISEYMGKRLKTYSEKYKKLHPRPRVFSVDEMVNAINMIFGIDKHLAQAFIKRTESGGAYIDATALLFNLNGRQAEIIDKMTGKVSNKNSLNYSFTVTDAIMKTYSEM